MLRRRQYPQSQEAVDPSSSPPPSSSASSTTSVSAKAGSSASGVDKEKMELLSERSPLLADAAGNEQQAEDDTMAWSRRNQWIFFAIASGACAAFNGVFAKLTTTELTTSFSQGIARVFGLSSIDGAIELIVRCTFFGLNLAFNGVMWTLFTTALARGHSTTQVSIMNTSSNFVLTAILGLAIFAESLPPLWWVGASMLVAGNVIIGRNKDEGEGTASPSSSPDDDGGRNLSGDDVVSATERGRGSYAPIPQIVIDGVLLPPEKDDEDEDVPRLGDLGGR